MDPKSSDIKREHERDIRRTQDKLRQILGPVERGLNEAAGQLASETYYKETPTTELIERGRASASSQMRPVLSESSQWSVAQVIRESGGKEIERWRVTGPNGYRYPTEFRHKITAMTMASILGETGGSVSDPRVARIESLASQETSLIKEINAHKKTRASVPSGNVTKREIYDNKIEDARERLSKVRSLLGVA